MAYYKKNHIAITSAKRARAAAKLIANARKQQNRIIESRMSSERKRIEIDRIGRQISKIADQFNRWYKARGEGG